MGRIFLSYAREDLDAAREFAAALERAGYQTWWDHHLRAGSRFSWDIDAALKGAEAVVVLWSKHSIESAWVQDEAAEGLEGSRLVPVTLDGSQPPLGFRQYHTIGLSDWRNGGAAFEQLVAAVEAKIAGTSVSSPPQPRAITPSQPTICVLPFVNKSADADQDYFSDGITEDVITDLSKVSALSVVGSNTSFALKGQSIDLKKLGDDHAVTHVLEGAVRKSASRLRITAQLVETSSGQSLWAERYDRELSDVFEIQDEISRAIVDALQLTLLPKEGTTLDRRGTADAEAYDTYLRARALWSAGNFGDYRSNEEIVRLCTEATARDQGYAIAWALMALASSELRFWQARPNDALTSAKRAMALDERLAEPHCVVARQLEEEGRGEEAEAAIELALGLDPDSWEANREAGQLAFHAGRARQAIEFFEKAVAAMRTDHHSASMLITCYEAIDDAAGVRRAALTALARAEHVIIADPTNGFAFASGAHALAALGECDRAAKWVRKALSVDPGNLSMRYELASTVAAQFKDEEQALEVLEPFAEAVRYPPHLRLLELDPSWRPIRDGDRFQTVLDRARKRVGAMVPGAATCSLSEAPSRGPR